MESSPINENSNLPSAALANTSPLPSGKEERRKRLKAIISNLKTIKIDSAQIGSLNNYFPPATGSESIASLPKSSLVTEDESEQKFKDSSYMIHAGKESGKEIFGMKNKDYEEFMNYLNSKKDSMPQETFNKWKQKADMANAEFKRLKSLLDKNKYGNWKAGSDNRLRLDRQDISPKYPENSGYKIGNSWYSVSTGSSYKFVDCVKIQGNGYADYKFVAGIEDSAFLRSNNKFEDDKTISERRNEKAIASYREYEDGRITINFEKDEYKQQMALLIKK